MNFLGWICYAEKTHGYMLPYVSETKSPQQIMGSMVKNHFGSQLGLR
jgi:iron only hydrogenase large subunit-like protein